ncbi:MAG: WD40/YVTN/BNR-like repeat-containing protein, partial [Nevskiales bacterium]
MNHTKKFAGIHSLNWVLVLLVPALFLTGCGKKDEAAPAEGAAPAAASASPAAEAAPAKAEPAEMLAKATQSRMLDVVHTGDAYVAVGERGHIVHSTDGKTWTQSPSPVRSTLTTVFFADAKNGWAGGHDASIVATRDGGKTWTLQLWAPELNVPVLDLYFFDAQRGIAVGAYGFYRTTADGGTTWTEAENAATTDEWHFNGITRLADSSLLLVGETGGVAHSKDEGVTWTKLESPYEGTFFGALPHGLTGAILYGLRGSVYVIENVATATPASWRKLETGTFQSVLGGTAASDGGLVMVGAA